MIRARTFLPALVTAISLLALAPITAEAASGTRAISLSAGVSQTCAALSDGRVKCWGRGVLGDGSGRRTSRVPVTVRGISTAIAVSTDGSISCALLQGGGAECWGKTSWVDEKFKKHGATNLLPVPVPALTGAVQLSAGSSGSCAVLSGGSIQCWGQGRYGALGDGTRADSLVPVTVAGINNATSVSIAISHACAVLADTTVRCWGTSGLLGHNALLDALTPIQVPGITDAKAIDVWEWDAIESCAILLGGRVDCWKPSYEHGSSKQFDRKRRLQWASGSSSFGRGAQTDQNWGFSIACAVLKTRTVRCNGNWSDWPKVRVRDIAGTRRAQVVAVGNYSGCALLATGSVKCWGRNDLGQLGDGTNDSHKRAVTVKRLIDPS